LNKTFKESLPQALPIEEGSKIISGGGEIGREEVGKEKIRKSWLRGRVFLYSESAGPVVNGSKEYRD